MLRSVGALAYAPMLALVFALGFVSACAHSAPQPTSTPLASAALPGFGPALARSLPATVGVYALEADDASTTGEVPRIGAGFVIDRLGHVVTASHVVARARRVVVRLDDRRVLPVRVVGIDEDADIALLALPVEWPHAPPLGRSTALRAGDWVIAVGEPYGLRSSVSAGIVGGTGRHFVEDREAVFIQSDIAMNPGNSGGPLITLAGDIVGMNTRTVASPYGSGGLCLSMPIELVLQIADELRRPAGQRERPRLGAFFEDVSPMVLATWDAAIEGGAAVTTVLPESLAEQADLRVGDVIVAMNGQAVEDGGALAQRLLLWRKASGTRFDVMRAGQRVTLELR
ncbi:S1C family serine protease [Caldimonas sp. KR1-144]|uniref:S1C family serine protease n=1 Tax=Caldimonas sp. KR1-144 TaxID=3400911 RepID=UPI003BFAEB4E